MKKQLLVALLLLPLFCLSQGKTGKLYNLVIGTRTYGASDGIYVYRFDIDSNKITYLNHIAGIADPTYLTISANNKFVYAVSDKRIGSGGVYAYKFDAVTGELDSINHQLAYGGPSHLTLDKAQKNLFCANYMGGSLSVYPLKEDGSIGELSQRIQNFGNGINRLMQEAPHVQSTLLSPDEKFLLSTDLGTDRMNIYKYDPTAVEDVLSPAPVPFISGNPGYGPRNATFSADGRFVYMLQEISGTITVYRFNKGKLAYVQLKSLVPDGFKGNIQAADMHLSPDGRFLYASNRGTANEIIQFAVNKTTGMLTLVKRYSSNGRSPRNFVIDPTGNYMLVSNQFSNNVSVFKIDKATGMLKLTPSKINIDAPMCIRFTPVK